MPNALRQKWNQLFFYHERIQCSAGHKSRDMTFWISEYLDFIFSAQENFQVLLANF